MAEDFPGDYDGIPARAPAIPWDRFPAGQIWYQLVQDRDNRMAPALCTAAVGDGPQPQGLFEAPVNWVELAKAPHPLLPAKTSAGRVTQIRPLCPYPRWSAGGEPEARTTRPTSFPGLCSANICSILMTVKRPANVSSALRSGRRRLLRTTFRLVGIHMRAGLNLLSAPGLVLGALLALIGAEAGVRARERQRAVSEAV